MHYLIGSTVWMGPRRHKDKQHITTSRLVTGFTAMRVDFHHNPTSEVGQQMIYCRLTRLLQDK